MNLSLEWRAPELLLKNDQIQNSFLEFISPYLDIQALRGCFSHSLRKSVN